MDEGAVRVSVEGELDIVNKGELEQRLKELIKEGIKKIIVDLKKLTYIDSTGIGVLAAASERIKIKRKGGEICIIYPKTIVEKVIKLTQLDNEIKIY